MKKWQDERVKIRKYVDYSPISFYIKKTVNSYYSIMRERLKEKS